MKQPVTQEDEMGCGAACVAFAAGVSYREIVDVLGVQRARTAGFRLKELRDALSSYNLMYRQSHINSISRTKMYEEESIVFIRRSKRYPYGHYLVRHDDRWMDPWINLPHDKELQRARSGYRRRLPGRAQWVVYRI